MDDLFGSTSRITPEPGTPVASDVPESGSITFPPPIPHVAPDTDILDNTVLEFDFGDKVYNLAVRKKGELETAYGAEFLTAVDSKVAHGSFAVKHINPGDGQHAYTIVEVELGDKWKVLADSREKLDWYDPQYSVEFPMFDDEPGLACLKIADAKDFVVAEVIFYEDGKISATGLALKSY